MVCFLKTALKAAVLWFQQFWATGTYTVILILTYLKIIMPFSQKNHITVEEWMYY